MCNGVPEGLWFFALCGVVVMGDAVWMSSVLKPTGMDDRVGARAKFFNHDWNPASFNIPLEPDEVYASFRKHRQGFALDRSELTEALAVFDERVFSRQKDLFYSGPFLAVQGKLAELLSKIDLGGGGLMPFPIYQSDLETPYPGKFWFLNFGCRKDTIQLDQCGDAREFVMNKVTGYMLHHINDFRPNDRVVFSSEALNGPDLWFEKSVHEMVFMSDALAQAITDIGMADVFRLHKCEVV